MNEARHSDTSLILVLRKHRQVISKFKINLIYKLSSSTVTTTQWDPVSREKKNESDLGKLKPCFQ